MDVPDTIYLSYDECDRSLRIREYQLERESEWDVAYDRRDTETCVWRIDIGELEAGDSARWHPSCEPDDVFLCESWEISYGAASEFRRCPYCGRRIEMEADNDHG